MRGAIEKAKELAAETPNAFIPGQFENPANPKIHRETTGPEIWEDTGGKVDILVSGVGTGGTITGTGEFLRSKNPDIKIVAVEPEASPELSGGNPGPHKIRASAQASFGCLNTNVYDEIIRVRMRTRLRPDANWPGPKGSGRHFLRRGGMGGVRAAKRPENAGKVIVAICPTRRALPVHTNVF